MSLDKPYTYYFVRSLRIVLPVVVVVLLVILIRNYLMEVSESRTGEESRPRLVEELSDLTEGLTYLQFEGERVVLDVQARSNLGFRDGRNLLEDVEVTVNGEAGEPQRRIHSDRCGIVQATRNMDCEGNVEIQLDPLTTARTSAIRYDHAKRTIGSQDSTAIVRPGHFDLRADRMVLELANNVFRLFGNVRVNTADGTEFDAGRAWFYEDEHRVGADGGLHVSSKKGELIGSRGEADLDAITSNARQVRVSGGASLRTLGREEPSTLTAGDLEITLVAGKPRELQGRGHVRLESGSDGQQRVLYGEAMRGSFAPDGRLDVVEASENAWMALGSTERLESGWIRHELPERIATREASVLQVGEFRVEGSDFLVERRETVHFRTDKPAHIRLPSGSTRGQRTEAEFDPAASALLHLVQTGGVEFEFSGRSGVAERLQVQGDGNQIVLDGHPKVRSGDLRIEAAEIALEQTNESFEATGSVRAVSEGEDLVVVQSGRARGGSEQIRFFQGAELWRGDTHVRAESIDIDQHNQSFVAESGVSSNIADTRIWADRLEFSEEQDNVHYLAAVRVETAQIRLTADDLVISLVDDQPEQIVAKGNVHVEGSGLEGRGEEAVYIRSSEQLILSGEDAEVSDPEGATVRGPRFDMDIENDVVTVTSDGGQRIVSRRVVEPH